MRFLARALTGLVLTLITLGLIGWGGLRLAESLGREEAPSRREAEERVYAVEVVRLEPVTLSPRLTAHGEIASARRLELRPARAGVLEALSPNYRDGGRVERGELLFRLDPAEAESELERAEIALIEAETETRLAAAAEAFSERDLDSAERQRELRAAALDRARDLRARGAGTDAAVEAAELALAVADQAALAREQALTAAAGRTAAAEVALRRARLARSDAARALMETEVRAPFGGLLTETAATPGRRVNAGERLGLLIDPDAFEAAVEVTTAEFARLLDDAGRLLPRPAVIALDLGGARAEVPAKLVRAGASAAGSATGRVLYVAAERGGPLREGDFVTVEIEEPPLERVAVIPATATTVDGRVLIVGEGERLLEHRVTVLRRTGAELVVADAPFGADMVLRRQPRLGPGVRVRPTRRADEASAAALGAGGGLSVRPDAAVAAETVTLDPARRARLSALVEADPSIPAERKASLLDRLAQPSVPRAVVEDIERAADGAPPGG